MNSSAVLVGLDWGTSSVRAFLFGADGMPLASRVEPWGVMRLPEGGFEAAFRLLTQDWLAGAPGLPVLACGMVGSTQGWCEAPYLDLPADADLLAHALVMPGEVPLRIVPGLRCNTPATDLMRGEETQVAGALSLHADLREQSIVVLPGTHSKWVAVEAGRIVRFSTVMTGELFAVLSRHSILGRPAQTAAVAAPRGSIAPEPPPGKAFRAGVLAAQGGRGGVMPLLFSVRTLVVTGALEAADSLEYLSGLLVGEEIRAMGESWGVVLKKQAGESSLPASINMALVGEAMLIERYRVALALLGIGPVLTVPDATTAGLWRIASSAGLVGRAGRSPAAGRNVP